MLSCLKGDVENGNESINILHETLSGSSDFAELAPKQVAIWGAELDQLMETVHLLEGELSEDERRRAQRFHFDKDRRQFIAARGLLRILLGKYLCKKPSQVRFEYNAYGKPSLAGSTLDFNLSHSGNRVLYGFAACQHIGVDIEKVRAASYADSIAQQNFTLREAKILKLYPDYAVDNFFIYWTCKEAVLKGMGRGITCSLQEIDLSCMVKEVRRSFELSIAGSNKERWVVTRLNHVPEYAGAVAVNGDGKQLVYREITKETLICLLQGTGGLM